MTVICFDSNLQSEIEKHIHAFFLLHNFGTRQTKGFGSFAVKGDYDKMALLKQYQSSFIYTQTSGTSEQKMNLAKTLWDLLKGGINFTSSIRKPDRYAPDRKKMWGTHRLAYQKSYLIRSFAAEGTGSEKAKLKSSGLLKKRYRHLEDEVKRVRIGSDYYEYRYLRALLGLTDTYRFSDFDIDDEIKVEGTEQECVNGKCVPKIQRFAAPVTIKIFDDFIVFLPKEIPQDMYGAQFTFKNSKTDKEIFKLTTPLSFDLPKLLFRFAEDFNREKKDFPAKVHPDFKYVSALTLQSFGGEPS